MLFGQALITLIDPSNETKKRIKKCLALNNFNKGKQEFNSIPKVAKIIISNQKD